MDGRVWDKGWSKRQRHTDKDEEFVLVAKRVYGSVRPYDRRRCLAFNRWFVDSQRADVYRSHWMNLNHRPMRFHLISVAIPISSMTPEPSIGAVHDKENI